MYPMTGPLYDGLHISHFLIAIAGGRRGLIDQQSTKCSNGWAVSRDSLFCFALFFIVVLEISTKSHSKLIIRRHDDITLKRWCSPRSAGEDPTSLMDTALLFEGLHR